MKRVYVIAFFTAIVATVAVSGCTNIFSGSGQSTPVPTVYGPMPSSMPTPTPTPTSGPAVANSKPSDTVKIITSPMDYKVVDDGKTRDGRQYETIHLIATNDDSQTAQKVVLTVTIINELNLNTLVYQEFQVGDLPRGEQRTMALTTDTHEPTNFIKMTIVAHWGAYSEYYSAAPFEHTYSFSI